MRSIITFIAFLILSNIVYTQSVSEDSTDKRNMTFLDVRKMNRAGSYAISLDKKWMLYTVTVPDWETAKDQSDIHLVSMTDGLSSHKQMTYTAEVSEKSPEWSVDGSYFVFLSKRDDKKDQIYMMRPDGGEARKITSEKEGVSNYEFSPDGKWFAYRSGKSGNQQLSILPANDLAGVEAEAITKQEAGVGRWEWAPDSKRIYFIGASEPDKDNETRKEKGFTVDVKNYETPLASLWTVDMDSKEAVKLTEDDAYTVSNFEISDDSKWVAYSGTSAKRYERNITEQRINADPFLLNVATGSIERLVQNEGVSEGSLSFSPDSKNIAFVASKDMSGYNMKSRRCYIRSVDAKGEPFRMIGTKFPDHVGLNFWSEDGKTIYFNTGMRATRQLFALDIEKDVIRQVTNETAALAVFKDEDSDALLVNYSDPKMPNTIFSVPSIAQVADRSQWTQLTDANPQVKQFKLGEQKEISYKSTDGKEVAGVLTLPVDYVPGQRYPLVVNIHGGPASADVLRFSSGSVGQHVYAGKGYVMFAPNYRGSTNYGEEHRTDIVGNYFPQAYEDIMAGVDYLIEEGIVDKDKMGVKGWSAGGHWSNWILTHTDRFKAISSGAGTMNWLSMYAQSDVQRNRQFYLGDDLPYDNFEAYWDQSPIKYIKNAKTPTMIHVVAGDPRVPSPQSVELHMALKKLGVDTELFMYPGKSHGIPDTRNRL
ncbi:MAG: S9 family peptidase, partial [Bacteroidia bacterium]|nr:S9 family peptidase [Bacteroidia bacterium]